MKREQVKPSKHYAHNAVRVDDFDREHPLDRKLREELNNNTNVEYGYAGIDGTIVTRRHGKVNEVNEYAKAVHKYARNESMVLSKIQALLNKGYRVKRIAKAFKVKPDYIMRRCHIGRLNIVPGPKPEPVTVDSKPAAYAEEFKNNMFADALNNPGVVNGRADMIVFDKDNKIAYPADLLTTTLSSNQEA